MGSETKIWRVLFRRGGIFTRWMVRAKSAEDAIDFVVKDGEREYHRKSMTASECTDLNVEGVVVSGW